VRSPGGRRGWISRSRETVPLPVCPCAATNPAPAGWFGDPQRACRCGEAYRQRYWSRLSGPCFDRISTCSGECDAGKQTTLVPRHLSPTPRQPAPISRPEPPRCALVPKASQRMVSATPAGLRHSA